MADNLRILHVVGDSAFGGGSRVVGDLAQDACERGQDVRVLATDPVFCAWLRERSIPVLDLDCIWRPVRPWRDLIGLRRLRSYLESNPVDLVHTHTSKAGFVGRLAARSAGIPSIMHTVHGFAFHECTPGLVRAAQVALERYAAKRCDRIVTVSRFHRDWALALGIAKADRIVAVPNGIRSHHPSQDLNPMALRAALGCGPDQHLVLSVGRLAPGKGLDHLLDAAAVIGDSGRTDIHTVIVGKGPMTTELQKRIDRAGPGLSIVLTGFRNDIPDLLAVADVVALASAREGMSIALLEAMAAGCGIVASDISSNREAAAGCAEFVPYGDVRALAGAILRIADNHEYRLALGTAASRIFADRYSLEHMLRSYREIYSELTGCG